MLITHKHELPMYVVVYMCASNLCNTGIFTIFSQNQAYLVQEQICLVVNSSLIVVNWLMT